jgi:hypothetical protein
VQQTTHGIGRNARQAKPRRVSRLRIVVVGVAVLVVVAAFRGWLPPAVDHAVDVVDSVRGRDLSDDGTFRDDALYVALYGHPGAPVLGSLGEQDVDAAVSRARRVARDYTSSDQPVVASFEIIATVAAANSGADGDYSNEFPESTFEPWIDAAADADMHVVLDLQPGRDTFPSQLAEIERLLAYPHVSLALDPEWRVGPTERPGGGRIGTVDGTEVNETVEALDALVRRHDLPPKMLVVHQFTDSMVTNRSIIRGTDNVRVVFQMDGFGSLSLKRGSWDRMVSDLPPGALTGWKNFYDEDQPTPTPDETLAQLPAPTYVSFQ